MSYAKDPYWAWKETMSPEQRQAYENQVAADRALDQRLHTGANWAMVGIGVLGAVEAYATRKERARQRQIDHYTKTYLPQDYTQRKAQMEAMLAVVVPGSPDFHRILEAYSDIVSYDAGLSQL